MNGDAMETKGLYGKKYLDLQVRKMEIAKPDEDSIIVKIHTCGICVTDINLLKNILGEITKYIY